MPAKNKTIQTEKQNLHPRNFHRGLYDFKALINSCSQLAPFVALNQYGNASIDFANPEAVKMLNKALLKHFYKIDWWDIPKNYLCPPIPGRVDCIHYVADLLGEENGKTIPEGDAIHVLDIGMGANCIYPILGHTIYGWRFTGSEIDPIAIRAARDIIANNPGLSGAIDCRLQLSSGNIFKNIVRPGDFFDMTICNPPFHASEEEALAGSQRKWKNLGIEKSPGLGRNFGGLHKELWCEGGEEAFINKMILESVQIQKQCLWFTTLVSKKEKLPAIYNALKQAKVFDIKTIDMAQGQKTSRIVAWTFLNAKEQKEWRIKRWVK